MIAILALAGLALWPEPPASPTGRWMAAAGLSPRYETIDALRVRYIRAGSGPTVILVHGLGSSIYTWRDVLPSLSRERDVVAVDLPGFGGSDQPADLSATSYPRVLGGLMERLAIRRATLVGHSLGGAAAVMLASEEPARVDRLALLAPAGFNLAPADRPWLLRLAASPLGRLLELLPPRRALVRIGLRQVFHDDTRVGPELVEEYWAPLARPGASAGIRSLLGAGSEEIAERFPAIAARVGSPTLIVWGRQDAWIPVTFASRFTEAIPSARLAILDGCGHMPQEERPEDVVRLLRELMELPQPLGRE